MKRVAVFKLIIVFAFNWTIGIATAGELRSLRIDANDLAYDAINDELLVSVSGTEKWIGNTISRIDPSTMHVLGSVYVGSQPNRISLSDSGLNLYVCLDGEGRVKKYDVVSREVGSSFSLGRVPNGYLRAEDVDVMPGSESIVAVSRTNTAVTDTEGAAIFDNGVMRPMLVDENFIDSIQFGPANLLYGVSTSTSSYAFSRMSVGPNGVTLIDYTISQTVFEGDLQYVDGRVYSRSRRVFSVEPLTLIKIFDRNGPCIVDQPSNKLYRTVRGSFELFLEIYDLTTLKLISSIVLPALDTPIRGVLCGPNRIAFTARAFDSTTWLYVYDL